MSFSVAVAGASGYAGGELLRLLASHPEFEVTTVTANQSAGQTLGSAQPHLRSMAGLVLDETTPEVLAGHDVVFLALPHGLSGELTAHLPDDTLVVDCGADHRLTSESDWADFYGGEYFGAWSYGMPELVLSGGGQQRDALVGARRIAVPGCNVTAITLGLAPSGPEWSRPPTSSPCSRSAPPAPGRA
jgi:N-acetyl-gamma-glutamyl-phosphate reductase